MPRVLPLLLFGLALSLFAGACTSKQVVQTTAGTVASLSRSEGNRTSRVAVRFLEERVKSDPDDLVALNKLASYYLSLHRETEDKKYLELAVRCAKASVEVLPADQNLGGLAALAQTELETHNFTAARDHAQEFTEYQPNKSFGYQLLGDALVELGEYDRAVVAYERMSQLDPESVASETRLAHFAVLHGDVATAQRRYSTALEIAKRALVPSNETIAWCHWQLGELAFSGGEIEEALTHYENALAVFADYPHALTSMARLKAAQGDLGAAIKIYESLVSKRADPIDNAALGDLYQLAGRPVDASRQFQQVDIESQRDLLSSALYNRHLVLFWADHDRNREQAYERARKEFDVRRDIYGADALAWAAFKAGKLKEAQTSSAAALRLGTRDARLFYHAGMIARAAGDLLTARKYLSRALELNPHFDPVHALVAQKALAE